MNEVSEFCMLLYYIYLLFQNWIPIITHLSLAQR